jgi:hypothetical protein
MYGRPSMQGMVYVRKAKHARDGVCMEGQACKGWCTYVWKAKHARDGVCMEGQACKG